MNYACLAVIQEASLTAMALVGAALFLTLIRLIRGPTLPDRAVALDLIGIQTVGMIAAYEIAYGQPLLLDAAMVVALVAFLGTIAFARYLERRGLDE